MSIEAMAHVWRTFRGDPTEKLVLLSLADQANNDGWCWPSQAYTAERCMISDRQLRNWIVRLADSGLIEVHSRPGKSNMYRVLTPEARFLRIIKNHQRITITLRYNLSLGVPTVGREPKQTAATTALP